MIYRIIGRSGSGKTSYILEAVKNAFESGKQCIVLTPEQQSLSMEKQLCDLLGSKYNLTTELLNFERLPDRIFRENGGAAYSRADSQTLSLYTALACEMSKEKLLIYEGAAFDRDFTKKMSSAIEKFEANNITPKALVDAASLLGDDRISFKNKLFDMGQIFFEYLTLVENGCCDSSTIQKLLSESLKENNFFKGKTVFIDGYYNFTKAEYPIVEMIFNGAEDTYITVLYDENDKSGIFDINQETLKLTEKARKGIKDIYPQNPRKRCSELSFLEKNLFNGKKESFSFENVQDGISIFSCESPFEESEFVAREIIKLTKEGYRYKDICISSRDLSIYDGILENALVKRNIPFYSAEKEELSSKELPSLILSLLEIAFTDWSTSSVLKYSTSTFSPLTSQESDLLSIYAESWRIRGKRWHNGEPWLMNPSGFKSTLSDREKEMLRVVNEGREKLVFALEAQIYDLKSRDLTISKGVKAIYNHLIHIKADKSLEQKALKLLQEGKEDEADKISSLWDSVMSILETLHKTAGNTKVSAKRLHNLLRLMMDEHKLGSLPSFSDSIEIGSASIIRPNDCKVMIVLGANDGIFPASPTSSGLFSDSEKEFLKSAGIESEPIADDIMKNEFLLFYNLCSAPTDKLIISYSQHDTSGKKLRPSVFTDTITDFFGNQCTKKYQKEKKKRSNAEKEKAKNTFDENTKLSPSNPPVLYLSPSKMEQYLKCPFSYYCKYVLGLEQYEKATLSSSEKGTFFHAILESFAKSLFETGEFKSKTPKEIKDFFETEKEKYKYEVFGGKTAERENFSFDSNEDLVIPLLQNLHDEFLNDNFVPVEFEENLSSSYEITDKTTAVLKGKVDRIDVLEEDGKKYVRVVDYKTGSKKISVSDVKKGFEMQMFTYLFSKCKNGEIPAGVMYFLCGLPTSENPLFARKGIMLNDTAVKENMNFLIKNKLYGSRSFQDESVFDEIKNAVETNVKTIGQDIIDGKMNSCPEKSKNPCKYCNARLYCRKKLEKE